MILHIFRLKREVGTTAITGKWLRRFVDFPMGERKGSRVAGIWFKQTFRRLVKTGIPTNIANDTYSERVSRNG